MAYSPDGKTLATGSFRELTLWDADKGEPRKRITGFADRVVAVTYSSDGKYIATGGGAATEDGEVKLFTAAGDPVAEFKNAHTDTVFGVSFSPDGKLLATAAADKFVKVFEVATGKVKAKHEKRRRRKEFLEFMDDVVAAYPKRRLEVILDNLNTHKKNDEWLAHHPRVTFHYTPTRASWLPK